MQIDRVAKNAWNYDSGHFLTVEEAERYLDE